MLRTTIAIAAASASSIAVAHHAESATNIHALEHVWQLLPIVVVAIAAAWFVVRRLRDD